MECRVVSAPRPVRGNDGEIHLAYELSITSFYDGETPLRLSRLAVFLDNSRVALKTVEGSDLSALLSEAAKGTDANAGISIATGQSKTLFVWLTLPRGTQPDAIRHQLTFEGSKGERQRADNIYIPVIRTPAIKIGPPLRGGRWMAVEGPGNHRSHHWGSLVAIDGKLSIPQRFAIDWFRLDDGNHSLRRAQIALPSTVDDDWVGYGSDVLAVAEGVVVDARDGIPNGKPLAPMAEPEDLTARTLYGNFVVLKIAPGVYAHYAHLQLGSLRVRTGQRVGRGTVIGLLGQTGSAGAPHLHLHLSDRPTFEQSEGLPFVIDSFENLGRGTIEDTFDRAKPVKLLPPRTGKRRLEMPLDGTIVAFR